MTAILGVDLGERRIGVAIADGEGGARALTTLPRRSTAADAAAIGEIVERERAVEVVVGLPLEAAGAEGRQATLTRAWVDELRPFLPAGVRLSLRDERLSSHLAETRLGPMPRGRSGGPPTRSQRTAYRARVDSEAAAIILQDELDARRAVQRTAATPTIRDMERST